MGNLVDTIKASLTDLQTIPWLPKLTGLLVKQGWKTLYRDTDITAVDYGTTRVLAGARNAPSCPRPRKQLSPLPSPWPGRGMQVISRYLGNSTPPMRIEILTGDAIRRYQKLGLVFYTPDEITNIIIDCLQDAIDVLAYVPTLQKTVAALVRTCHLLNPEDDDYDVSHSDPQVPFSIFVSVPRRRRPDDALRVVESIVHEAMHLQLTLIEQVLPLVRLSGPAYFSPWKGTYRPPQGVLHALYVFRVIDRFLEQLQALPAWSAASADYMRHRRDEITRQIGEIETFQDCPALTAWGAAVVRKLLTN